MNEHDLTKQVSAWLAQCAKTAPLWWMKVHGGPYQRAGVHDYVLCVDGLFATIELKHPTDLSSVASPLQRRQADLIARAGGSVLLEARSMADVEAFIDAGLSRVRRFYGLQERG